VFVAEQYSVWGLRSGGFGRMSAKIPSWWRWLWGGVMPDWKCQSTGGASIIDFVHSLIFF